jgi:hypothetical protein
MVHNAILWDECNFSACFFSSMIVIIFSFAGIEGYFSIRHC